MKKLLSALTVLAALALVQPVHAHKDHHKEDKMKMMDTNGDGKISAQEHADGAKAMFAKMDANSDGFLTKEEMDAGHKKMMK